MSAQITIDDRIVNMPPICNRIVRGIKKKKINKYNMNTIDGGGGGGRRTGSIYYSFLTPWPPFSRPMDVSICYHMQLFDLFIIQACRRNGCRENSLTTRTKKKTHKDEYCETLVLYVHLYLTHYYNFINRHVRSSSDRQAHIQPCNLNRLGVSLICYFSFFFIIQ